MSHGEYLVLAFGVGEDQSFVEASSIRAETANAALLVGALHAQPGKGVIVIREVGSRVVVLASFGLAEEPSVLAYALADLRFGLWPQPTAEVALRMSRAL